MANPAFVKQCATWTAHTYGSGGITSGSFSPTNAGDLILAFAFDDSSPSTQTVTGTGTYGLVTPPGQLTGNNGTGFALWGNVNSTTASQTCLLKSSSTGHTGLGVILEFSGCSKALQGITQGTALTDVFISSPGTGTGAIVANAGIQVPTGAMLVTCCLDNSSTTIPVAHTGTSISTGSGGSNTAWNITTQAGSGTVLTPSFTAGTGGGSDLYTIVWFVLYPGIYVKQSINGAEKSSGAVTATMPGAVTAGNPIVLVTAGWGPTSSPFPLTITDSVNTSGTYTALNEHWDSTSTYFCAVHMLTSSLAGTPTVGMTPGVAYSDAFTGIAELAGFVGTPTSDATAAVYTMDQTATSTQAGNVSTGQSNELIFVAPWNESVINSGITGNPYVPFNVSDLDDVYYSNNIPSAQAWNFSASMSSASKTLTLFAGVYDAAGTSYSLSAADGTYTETGESATLVRAKYLSSAYGSYTLTGEATTLHHNYNVSGAHGTYIFTGENVSFTTNGNNYSLSTAFGSYAENGQTATLLHNLTYDVLANTGSYSLIGAPAVNQTGLPIIYGTYSLSGRNASLTLQGLVPSSTVSSRRRFFGRYGHGR